MTASRRTANNASIGRVLVTSAFVAACIWQPQWIVSGSVWVTAQASNSLAEVLGSDWAIRLASVYVELCMRVGRIAVASLLQR